MQERIIENWLINASERMFQIPFVQILINKGYKVLHISSHGTGEHGKDIIAISPENTPICFQLKKGDINTSEWRNIISEVNDMIETSINHPQIDPKIMHKSVIVCSGMMSDDVRLTITEKNIKNESRGLGKLEIITQKEIVQDLLELHKNFFPIEPIQLKEFLFFYTYDGRSNLPEKEWSNWVYIILFDNTILSEQTIKRKVASASVLFEYSLNNFDINNNYISLIKAWVIFLSYVYSLIEKNSLEINELTDIINIYYEKILGLFVCFKKEVMSKEDYLEGILFGEGAGLLYSARITIVLSFLASYELFQKHINNDYVIDQNLIDRIKNSYQKEEFCFLGESMSILVFMLIRLLIEANEHDLGFKILMDITKSLVIENNPNQKLGYPDVYFPIDHLLETHYSIPGTEDIPYKTFIGSSYTARIFIEFLARNNKREFLESIWKEISYLFYTEFQKMDKWEFLLWQSESGNIEEYKYPQPMSWNNLYTESMHEINYDELPKVFNNSNNILFKLLFPLIFPHRFNRTTAKFI